MMVSNVEDNITSDDENNVLSVESHTLLFFMIIVAGSYLDRLFGCKLQKLLDKNLLVQHIAGFFTMFFFVILSIDTNERSFTNLIFFGIYTYFIFFCLSKCDINFVVIILLIFFGVHFFSVYNNYNKKTTDKSEIKLQNYKKNIFNKICKFLYVVIIILLIIGVSIYFMKKKLQYGENFRIKKFLFNNKCSNSEFNKSNLEVINEFKDYLLQKIKKK